MTKGKIALQCVACKSRRSITLTQAAKGQPFCPSCGNIEIAVSAKVKIRDDTEAATRR